MKKLIAVLLAFVLISLMGCEKKDDTEQQSTDAVPKIDLHSAIVTNDLNIIRQHIKAGSDLNVLEPSRASTPLITAAALGNAEAAKLLIEAGSELNYKNVDGSTALVTSVVFGTTDVARLLIDSGADLNITNNLGSTALHTGAFFGRTEIVKALLEKGANKTIKNNAGQTPYDMVIAPFEEVKGTYDAIGANLKPLGIKLDYEQIKTARPKIAALLK
jgi:uncharacterized lipoprotein YehR (DUF1307 family)